MKLRSNPFAAVSFALVTSVVINSSQAADQFWNPLPLTDDWANSVWSATSGGGSLTTWTASNDAVFDQAGTYTATINADQVATNLNIKGGTVTFAGTNVASSTNLTIDIGATLSGAGDRYLKVGTTALTVNGTLDYTALTLTTRRISIAGGNGSIVLGAGLRMAGPITFAGNISGTGALITDAAGTIDLSGNNTYSGDTLIRSGNILRLGSSTALSANSFLRFGAGTNVVELTTGNFSRSVSATTAAGAVRFSGPGDAGGNSGFAAVGADRTVALNGTVTWGTASAGAFSPTALVLGSAASTHKVTLTTGFDLNGATRTITGVDGSALVEGEISGTISNSSATAATLTKTGAGTLLLSGDITGNFGGGSAISLNINGGNLLLSGGTFSGAGGITTTAGTTEISGAGTTTFTGNVTVGGGNLLVKRNDALGTGAGTTTCSAGTSQGTLQFDASGGDLTYPEALTLQMRTSLVTSSTSQMKPNFNNLAGNTTLTGVISGTTGGSVTKISSDAGLLTISNALTQIGGGTRISTLQGAGNANITGTITEAVGTIQRVDKMGTGTWTVSNALNSFTGGVRLLEGTLAVTGLGNGGVAGVLGAATNVADNIYFNGGSLKYTGPGETSDRLFTVGASGGTIEASGGGNLILGNIGAIITADGGIPVASTLQYTFPTASTTLAVNDPSTLSPGMDVGGTAGLVAGTKIVSVNKSTSIVTIDIPTSAVSGAAAFTGTASGVLNRVINLTGTNIGANEIKGILADAANTGKLGISKSGTGTWVLSGPNTYTGATTVTEGTLALVGGSQASPITVSSGATLGFTLGSPVTSTSTVTFSGATAKVNVSGTPVAATLLTATSITGTPVLDPAIPGFALAIEDSGTTLKLKAAGSNNYSTWATTNGVPGQAIQLDHDNDGVSNGIEYFIGGPTGNTTGFTSLPSVITTLGVRSITWVKAASYTGVYGTDFAVETSTTLVGAWATEASPGTVAISGINVTYTFPAGPVKNFARLKVTGP